MICNTYNIKISLCHRLSKLISGPAGISTGVRHLDVLDQQRVDFVIHVQESEPVSGLYDFSISHPKT